MVGKLFDFAVHVKFWVFGLFQRRLFQLFGRSHTLKQFLDQGKIGILVICTRHLPGVGHVQDSTRISKLDLSHQNDIKAHQNHFVTHQNHIMAYQNNNMAYQIYVMNYLNHMRCTRTILRLTKNILTHTRTILWLSRTIL